MKKEVYYLWNLSPDQDAFPEDTKRAPRPDARAVLFQNGPSDRTAADALLELISNHLSSSSPGGQSGEQR